MRHGMAAERMTSPRSRAIGVEIERSFSLAKSRPSVQKRNNEAKKMAKAQEKALKRAAREAARAERGEEEAPEGIDPDLAGIVAGPQPIIEDPLSVL